MRMLARDDLARGFDRMKRFVEDFDLGTEAREIEIAHAEDDIAVHDVEDRFAAQFVAARQFRACADSSFGFVGQRGETVRYRTLAQACDVGVDHALERFARAGVEHARFRYAGSAERRAQIARRAFEQCVAALEQHEPAFFAVIAVDGVVETVNPERSRRTNRQRCSCAQARARVPSGSARREEARMRGTARVLRFACTSTPRVPKEPT